MIEPTGQTSAQFFSTIFDFLSRRLPNFQPTNRYQPLSGGLLNYVWRVYGGPGSNPPSLIVKMAPPYIASAPAIPLDPTRILIEARAMTAFAPGGSLAHVATDEARPPQLLAQDETQHLLIMEDVGQVRDLGAWLRTPQHEERVRQVGEQLGQFIGRLHLHSYGRGDLAEALANLSIQQTRLELQYRAVRGYCQRAGLSDAAELGQRAEALGELFLQPGRCAIMGDLWPPSILVASPGLRIIDWEFAHYGCPAQDVGHLAAHLWMHAHRASDSAKAHRCHTLLAAFLKSYRAVIAPVFDELFGAEGLSQSCLHFGAEVLARTVGIFQEGYLYSGLAPDNSLIQQAVQMAAAHLRAPHPGNVFATF